ncbi:hypothetical protein BJX63DRAFT_416038 [Aspergillus granulosus]|uniref:Uncharacterized protein n=1 Tax=Aspergillus granulosus TaxID=176169 RepID=A0ABR4GSI1_9EURO
MGRLRTYCTCRTAMARCRSGRSDLEISRRYCAMRVYLYIGICAWISLVRGSGPGTRNSEGPETVHKLDVSPQRVDEVNQKKNQGNRPRYLNQIS